MRWYSCRKPSTMVRWDEQAVRDGNIVTANGSGYLEFAKELLLLLENETPEMNERYYQFNKQGLGKVVGYETLKDHPHYHH